jgi:hypothetical protein
MNLTSERAFATVPEHMYATGYSIRPLRSRREAPLRHLGRWSLILLAAAALAIAAARYPGDDVRVRIDEIERLNGLHSPQIGVGEVLQLPG